MRPTHHLHGGCALTLSLTDRLSPSTPQENIIFVQSCRVDEQYVACVFVFLCSGYLMISACEGGVWGSDWTWDYNIQTRHHQSHQSQRFSDCQLHVRFLEPSVRTTEPGPCWSWTVTLLQCSHIFRSLRVVEVRLLCSPRILLYQLWFQQYVCEV